MIRLQPEHNAFSEQVYAEAKNFGRYIIQLKANDRQARYTDTGYVVFDGIYYNGTATVRIIDFTENGIALHPRSGKLEQMPLLVDGGETSIVGVAGGWNNGTTSLTTKYAYPMVDSDNATFLYNKDSGGAETGEFMGSNSNYGNLYWSNEKTSMNDLVILSWRGTPTRHFQVSETSSIDGFTTIKSQVLDTMGTESLMSSFGTKIYRNGQIYLESPKYSWATGDILDSRCLILGASQDENLVTYIITLSDQTNAPAFVRVYSDGTRQNGTETPRPKSGSTLLYEHYMTKPDKVWAASRGEWRQPSRGIFLQCWKSGSIIDGWDKLLEVKIDEELSILGKAEQVWFASPDGLTFTASDGSKIAINQNAAIYSVSGTHYGTFTQSMQAQAQDKDMTFRATATMDKYFEPLLSASVSAESTITSNVKVRDRITKTFEGTFPVVTGPAVVDQGPLQVTCVNNQHVVSGGLPPYRYWTPRMENGTLVLDELFAGVGQNPLDATNPCIRYITSTCPYIEVFYVTDTCFPLKNDKPDGVPFKFTRQNLLSPSISEVTITGPGDFVSLSQYTVSGGIRPWLKFESESCAMGRLEAWDCNPDAKEVIVGEPAPSNPTGGDVLVATMRVRLAGGHWDATVTTLPTDVPYFAYGSGVQVIDEEFEYNPQLYAAIGPKGTTAQFNCASTRIHYVGDSCRDPAYDVYELFVYEDVVASGTPDCIVDGVGLSNGASTSDYPAILPLGCYKGGTLYYKATGYPGGGYTSRINMSTSYGSLSGYTCYVNVRQWKC